MKHFILPLAAVIVLASCQPNQNDSNYTHTIDTTKVHPSVIYDVEKIDSATGERKISDRDYSIDSSNSYSKFFFDSLKLVEYFKNNNMTDTMQKRMLSFYNTRNYQYAWFDKSGALEDTRGFWNMHSYYTTYENEKVLTDSSLIKRVDKYLTDEKLSSDSSFKPNNTDLLNTEFRLTQHFIAYTLLNYDKGYLHKKEIEYIIPVRKLDPMQVADSLVKFYNSPDYHGHVSNAYTSLKDVLIKYYDISKNGGIEVISPTLSNLDSGKANKDVKMVKERLVLLGYHPATDTSNRSDTAFIQSLKNYQTSIGYKPTGKLTAVQLKEMNVPVEVRIETILINLNRARWQINPPAGRLITVNIPEYVLHVWQDSQKVFDMNVVVGKQANNTMLFTGNLSNVVFSPYWNVPLSITKNEILPAMRRSGNYLARNNMEVYGSWGGGIPRIRQKPGPKNSLGLVKFLFPNSYDIYFHDSPAKSLFNRDKRAYSHGCIRLQEPKKMAEYILGNDSAYTSQKIDSLMHLSKEKWVKVKNPIPVMISYNTAWVDEKGVAHFAEDIYNRDGEQRKKLFLNKTSSTTKDIENSNKKIDTSGITVTPAFIIKDFV